MEERMGRSEKWEGKRMKEGGMGEEGGMIRELEIRIDKKEREERRKNVLVRRVEIGVKGMEEGVKEVWRRMELKVEMREVKRPGNGQKEEDGMVLVKLDSLKEKRKVMEAKKLRRRRERIEDDLTVEERKTKWRIEREAEAERRRGRRVQVGYMKMWVDRKIQRWDEVGEKWWEMKRN
ncbi:hypothetical protein EAI_15286 [Harpegnathos saltator]|uniref:Uncharacterized protein n=1 Tax=Harpegnathos saltator TaxID=610380 RepID=E2B8C0_HARSA|nr:hypothetical protein EAI_15286 [Harpegnathos saltator]